jgi:hypothetical protein
MKFLFIILLSYACIATAQDIKIFKPDPVKKKIEAVEISSTLKIDGKLDEEDWSKAKTSPRFTQVAPDQGAKPTFDTRVKVVYNNNYLYIGITCLDSMGKKAIRATDFKRDFDHMKHDLVNIGFDCFNDERNAVSFVINPYGVQRDYLAFDALYYDIEWDGLWRANTARTDSGWLAEVAIPWKTLRYPKSKETVQDWGFQIYRNRRMTNELSGFSPFPLTFSASRMDYAGLLTNLKPPPPKTNIRIQPYVMTSFDRYHGSDFEMKNREETGLKAGGELKWAVNPNNVLDLTINTDFAQADVDRRVNNTTRFNVFYPERRQFFLENASLFGINVGLPSGTVGRTGGPMQMQPFFSRSIGMNDGGEMIPIEAGGRFVHRSSKQNYGAVLMRQKGDSITSPANFFVGRFSENFGKQNRIGGLMTLKNQPEGSNLTGTVDAFIRLKEAHSFNTMISYSGTTSSGKKGFAGITQYNYSTNTWKLWWTQSVVSKNFNPEMGFISRNNVIGTTPGFIRYFRGGKLPFKKWIRSFDPGVDVQFYHQASTGKLIERQVIIYPFYLNLQNAGYLGYGVNNIFQHLPATFSPLGIEIGPGDYRYIQHTVTASSDPSKKINAKGTINWGDYFNGRLTSGDLQAFFAPVPHISIGFQFNRNQFHSVGNNLISKTVDLYSFEGRFALNPRLQLSSFFQKNSENNLYNVNVRFSWEYQPLSFFYIVFNRHFYDNELQYRQIEEQLIAKVSFLKQF